jgi:hypothetical protein
MNNLQIRINMQICAKLKTCALSNNMGFRIEYQTFLHYI